MAPISTKAHGAIDYASGAALVAAPSLLGITDVRTATLAPRLQGAAAGLYSLATDYELGVVRVLPMRAHLALDVLGGAFLAASPWLLGFAASGRRYWMPHLAVGVSEVAIALLTEREAPAGRG